jgi:hypothetical protein
VHSELEPKPKQILYLDQNFLSNLAKVENILDWKDPQRGYYERLLYVIRAKVNQNRLACPTSPSQREESEQSNRIKGIVWPLVEELSHGLSFQHPIQIFNNQIVLAAYTYCGKEPPRVPTWAVAFNKDPHESIEPVAGPGKVLVHLESPEELIGKYRDVKALINDVYYEFKATRRGGSDSFIQEVDRLKYQILLEAFLPPQVLIQAFPVFDDYLGRIASAPMTQMQQRIFRILMGCPNSGGFVTSRELLECPYLTIRASLMAVDIRNNPKKDRTGSINADFDIVASVMPYVDILTTDRYMAEMIRQAKLSQQFGARVYSMNCGSELLEALENL